MLVIIVVLTVGDLRSDVRTLTGAILVFTWEKAEKAFIVLIFGQQAAESSYSDNIFSADQYRDWFFILEDRIAPAP